MVDASTAKLSSMHFHGWQLGLKTGFLDLLKSFFFWGAFPLIPLPFGDFHGPLGQIQGLYYLRTKAAADAIKFTVDVETLKRSSVSSDSDGSLESRPWPVRNRGGCKGLDQGRSLDLCHFTTKEECLHHDLYLHNRIKVQFFKMEFSDADAKNWCPLSGLVCKTLRGQPSTPWRPKVQSTPVRRVALRDRSSWGEGWVNCSP